jgi:iron-sulfur cluster assembly protein
MTGQTITITEAAARRAKDLLARVDEPVLGLRIGVDTRGCNGLMYSVEYAKDQRDMDEVIETDGVKIFVSAMAAMYLLGSEMDYVEEKFESGFVFNNPNEKSRCGCGESFMV